MVPLGGGPLIINPIYILYSRYLLGVSPFKGLVIGEVEQLGAPPCQGYHLFFPVNMGSADSLLHEKTSMDVSVYISKGTYVCHLHVGIYISIIV